MCGIAGILQFDGAPVSSPLIKRMTDSIAHRGPDGEGQFIETAVGLGHRRLAIIDLTEAGHQPMVSTCDRYVIIYNGEVYNFQEIRTELEAKGHGFRSRTDTEVILNAYKEWGPDCLSRFNGMFAFVIYDRKDRALFIARDRYGVKPLYYYLDDKRFIFASEIKAILECKIPRAVDLEALNEYFTFQNTFTYRTLFKGVRLFPPGHWSILSGREAGPLEFKQYWDYNFVEDRRLPEQEAGQVLLKVFEKGTTRQLVSDVPVGCYLSGGLDSGSITAVASKNLGRIHSFSCGFDLSSASGLELAFDERAAAEELANLCKTEHYEVVLHAGDMEQVMPNLIWHQEDLRVGQCYPNYYIARLASKFVKVVLSGAGGDELFGGYPWRYYRGIGGNGRDAYYRNYYDFWQRLVPDTEKPKLFQPRTALALDGHSTFDVFMNVFSGHQFALDRPEDYVNASLYFEAKTFLHGLFVVDDKLSMAHSLEARVPFLDNDLVDLAMHLPVRYKLARLEEVARENENTPGKKVARYIEKTNDGKNILRKALQPLIRQAHLERHKQGFSAPDASWFRGESIDYVQSLLANPKARVAEYLSPAYVNTVLEEHGAGKKNHRLLIWSFLSFEWWLRKFMN